MVHQMAQEYEYKTWATLARMYGAVKNKFVNVLHYYLLSLTSYCKTLSCLVKAFQKLQFI